MRRVAGLLLILITCAVLLSGQPAPVQADPLPTVSITFDDPEEEYQFLQYQYNASSSVYDTAIVSNSAALSGSNGAKGLIVVRPAIPAYALAPSVLVKLPGYCYKVRKVELAFKSGTASTTAVRLDTALYTNYSGGILQSLGGLNYMSNFPSNARGTWLNAGWEFTGTNYTLNYPKAISFSLVQGSGAASYPTDPNAYLYIDNINIWCTETVDALFEADPVTGTAPLTVDFTNHSRNATSYEWDLGDGNTSTETNVTYTYTLPGIYTVTLTATGSLGTDTYSQQITVTENEAANLTKPLKLVDMDTEWGMFDYEGLRTFYPDYFLFYPRSDDELGSLTAWVSALNPENLDEINPTHLFNPSENDVFAFSREPSSIHSVAPGTVTSVEVITEDKCPVTYVTLFNLLADSCWVKVPSPIGVTDRIYRLDLSGVYVVQVETTFGNTIEYLIKAPTVRVGDTVDFGCVLGITPNLLSLEGAELTGVAGTIVSQLLQITALVNPSDIPTTFNTGKGVAVLRMLDTDGERVRLYDKLVEEPTKDLPCNLSTAFEGCLGDAVFSDPSQWYSTGIISNYSVTLPPGASISAATPYLLLNDTAYEMAVTTEFNTPGNLLELQLGNRIERPASSLNDPQSYLYLIHAAPNSGDAGEVGGSGLYTVRVTNISSATVVLKSLCVSAAGEVGDKGQCNLDNNSFDFPINGALSGGALTNWTGASATDYSGYVLIPTGAYISQELSLQPGTYFFDIQARVAYLTGVEPYEGDEISVMVEWLTGDDFTDEELLNPVWNAPGEAGYPDQPQRVSFTHTITEAESGTFRIYAWGNPNDRIRGLYIDRACVYQDINGEVPGSGTAEDLPFAETCEIPPRPVSNLDFGAWINYHWLRLGQFFNCTLMVRLNALYVTALELRSFLMWQLLWAQASMNTVTTWLNTDLLPWLNGHFNNLAKASGLTVVQPGSSLWDVLYALIDRVLAPLTDLLVQLTQQVANLLLGVISALVQLILAVVLKLLELLGLLPMLISGIINAWNNTPPADISWLPNCQIDPRANTFCHLSWLYENTVGGTAAGSLIIPMIIALASIELIMWVITEIRAAIMETTVS